MSDSINLMPDQKRLNDRYINILNPKPIDTRSGDEIALDVITNLGLRLNE